MCSIAVALIGHTILVVSAIPSVIARPGGSIACFTVGLVIMGVGTGGFKYVPEWPYHLSRILLIMNVPKIQYLPPDCRTVQGGEDVYRHYQERRARDCGSRVDGLSHLPLLLHDDQHRCPYWTDLHGLCGEVCWLLAGILASHRHVLPLPTGSFHLPQSIQPCPPCWLRIRQSIEGVGFSDEGQ